MQFERHWDARQEFEAEEERKSKPHAVNNFEEKDRSLVIAAISKFNVTYRERAWELYICNKAYTVHGDLLENHFALMHATNSDLSNFWNIFNYLKEEYRNGRK